MRTQRTFLRRDLYRLIYKYSSKTREEGFSIDNCYRRIPFWFITHDSEYNRKLLAEAAKFEKSLYHLDEENKRFVKLD